MQLDAVEAGFAGAPRAMCEGIDQLLDLSGTHRAAEEPVQGFFPAGWAGSRTVLVVYTRHVHLPARVAELHDELAVKAVDSLSQLFPEWDEVVAVDRCIASNDPSFHCDRNVGRNNRTHATLGELALPIDPRLCQGAVFVIESARNIGPKDPVFDGKIFKS